MDAGEVAVEDDHVVAVDGDPFEGGFPVVDHVDRHRLPAQAAGDGVGQDRLVFHYQHTHRPSMVRPLHVTLA